MAPKASFAEQELKKIIRVIWEGKWIIAISVVISMIPAFVYNKLATPTYQASATMALEQIDDFLPFGSRPTQNIFMRDIYVKNRMVEMKSRSVAKAVADELPADVIEKLLPPSDSLAQNNREEALITRVQGSISVEPVGGSDIFRISAEATDPFVAFTLANQLAHAYIEQYTKSRRESVSGVRKFLEQQLEIYRQRLEAAEFALAAFKEQNEIITLDDQAKELLNRYTSAEVLYNSTHAERVAKERRLEYIGQQIAKEKQGLVPSLTNITSPWTNKLKDQLVDLELQYTELKLQNYSEDHPRMLQLKERINQTKENLTSEALKLAEGEGLVDAFSQIRSYLEESLSLQVEIETYKAREATVSKTIHEYDKLLDDFPSQELQMARLTREKDVNEQTYLLLMQKREEARISEAEKPSGMRIVDEAQMPRAPVKPRKRSNLIIAFLLGGFVGLAVILVKEFFQDSIKTPEELTTTTDWSILASIPSYQSKKLKLSANGNNGTASVFSKEAMSGDKMFKARREIILATSNGSPETEGYHILRTNVQLLLKKDAVGTLLVTSSSPKEGKSTTAINLAVAFATQGLRTLLLDMDIKRPIIHSVFDLPKEPGFVELLRSMRKRKGETNNSPSSVYGNSRAATPAQQAEGSSPISQITFNTDLVFDIIHSVGIPDLFVLPTGSFQNNRIPYFNSEALAKSLGILESLFDCIVIDAPPILLVPEAMLIASLVKNLIFVVDAQSTPKHSLLRSRELLEKISAHVVGAVLNNVDFKKAYGKKYYYYYSQS